MQVRVVGECEFGLVGKCGAGSRALGLRGRADGPGGEVDRP